jgi:hypothetical protein
MHNGLNNNICCRQTNNKNVDYFIFQVAISNMHKGLEAYLQHVQGSLHWALHVLMSEPPMHREVFN